jgi:hypothetical protein
MRRPVLYPFLAAVLPVLALAAANPGEIPGLWVLTRPLFGSLAVSLSAWLLFSLFTKDADRRAFLTLTVVVLFASYGYIVMNVKEMSWIAPYADSVLFFLLIVSYLTAAVFLVFRLRPDLRRLTRFLNLATAILVAWNIVALLREATWRTDSAEIKRFDASEAGSTVIRKSPPDIYLIVLDKYSGSGSLKANFGFGNDEFERYLKERGFILPQNAQANYIYTQLSLASLLNYRYLDEFSPKPGAENRQKAELNRLVQNSAAWRFLSARGYRFIFFPTLFPVTGNNPFADLQIPDPREIVSEFEFVWRRTTLAEPILVWLCQRLPCSRRVTPFAGEPELLEWKLEQLSRLPKTQAHDRPLFVFAHFLSPHEPYVFNADCTLRKPPFWPSFSVVQDEEPEKAAYIAQVRCINSKIENVVERLLRDSPAPPIILLQSDHGHGRMPLHIPDADAVTPDRRTERAHIFAAYYLPGANRDIVYDSISPVNVFRAVFREYFEVDLKPLPDKTYWSPGTNLFQFTRVNGGQPSPQ